MTKTIYRGVHSTSITFANSIKANGAAASPEGRAGAGFYLWSYVSEPTHAVELAEDWHRDCYNRGEYGKCSEPALALLFYEIELDPAEVVNLNSTAHHEIIAAKVGRAGKKAAVSKAWDDHIKGISAFRLEKMGKHLKMVEVQLPVPTTTKDRVYARRQVSLTVGGDSYIVLPNALGELKLVDVRI